MSTINYNLTYIFSSDERNGALNVSNNGSEFSVIFDRPLIIPKNAMNIQMYVYEASVWYNTPNITELNNKFKLTYFDGTISADYEITIPTGLYSMDDLNNVINRLLVNAGAPDSLITIIFDNSTQKSVIQINVTSPETISIDFTINNNIASLLGFNEAVIAATSGPISIYGDNVANLNTTNYYLIHSSLAENGIRINNKLNQTICKVPITVSPGQLIEFEAGNLIPISCQNLKNRSVNSCRFWLTNDADIKVDTLGEYWSVTLVISYQMKIYDKS